MTRSWLITALPLVACAIGQGSTDSSGAMTLGMATSSANDGGSTTAVSAGTPADSSSGSGPNSDSGSDSDSGFSTPPDMGPPPMGCGDAMVDGDEECDDGNEDACDGCAQCMRRTSLLLDGARGTFVQIGDVADAPLALLDTPLTVEAWIRVDGPDDRVEVMRRGAGNAGWRMSLRPTAVVATVFGGFDHVANMVRITEGWHHVAWTYDQAVSQLYLDGALVDEVAMSDPVMSTDAPLRIGGLVSGDGMLTGYVPGRIDELRVSTAVRYIGPFEPSVRHEPDGATVLLMHFDEGEGTEMSDASSYLHPATSTGVAWEDYDGYGGCG